MKNVIRRSCEVEDCEEDYFALGYCCKHYFRFRKYGNPFFTKHHGMCHTSEYKVWKEMIQRCYNKKCTVYKYYGARGITVCDRWLHSFKNFHEDMGPKPFKGAQIDREDNDGNYEPDNCCWATRTQNNRNKRNNKLTMKKARRIRVKYAKGKITQRELAAKHNVASSIISDIVNNKIWKEIL